MILLLAKAVSLMILAALLSACAHRVDRSSKPTPSIISAAEPLGSPLASPEPPPPLDFEHPLNPYGIEVETSQEASLSFTPQNPPDSIGAVIRIVATDPTKLDESASAIVWVLQGQHSEFELAESAPGLTQSQLEELSYCHQDEVGCSTSGWSLIDIGAPGSALLVDGSKATLGSSATSVTWIDHDVKFVVIGPVETLTAADAISIAEQVVLA